MKRSRSTKGVPHSWTLAHLAMRHASGSAAANAWLHRGVGCGSCVLEIVVSSRPVTFTRVHTRQVSCSDRTPLCAHAPFRLRSVPALRSGVLDIGLGSRLSGPTIPTPPPGALGALSSNARARSLAARSLAALSPPSRSSVSCRASLSACCGFLSRGSRPPPMLAAAPRPSGTSSGGGRSPAWRCRP